MPGGGRRKIRRASSEAHDHAGRGRVLQKKHTTTPSVVVRKTVCETFALDRRIETVSTPYGPLRVKYAEGYGVTRAKAEYEDVARMARETGRSLTDMTDALTPYLHGAEEKTP